MVVAIIAILASLLLPALGRVKGLAKQINCLSHLKSSHYGIQSYLVDSRDVLTIGWYKNDWSDWSGWVPNLVNGNYLEIGRSPAAVWLCPETDPAFCTVKTCGYGMNFYGAACGNTFFESGFGLTTIDDGAQSWVLLRANKLKTTLSSYLLLADSVAVGPEWGVPLSKGYPHQWLSPTGASGVWCRHNSSASCLFADGHAQSMHLGELRQELGKYKIAPYDF
jgi:prepilin-type processing-associated H-X9-DG protein